MKKITLCKYLLAIIFYLLPFGLKAQNPGGINYQAVARDATGKLLENRALTLTFSILSGEEASNLAYAEEHMVTTNAFGQFAIVLGTGNPTLGSFSEIKWSENAHHLKVEIDAGDGPVDMGVSQLQRVPYAFSTLKATDMDMDLLKDVNTLGVTEGQVLKWDGTQWLPANDIGGGTGDNWGNQSVESDGSIEGKGIPSDPIKIASQGASEGQVLKWSESVQSWLPSDELSNTSEVFWTKEDDEDLRYKGDIIIGADRVADDMAEIIRIISYDTQWELGSALVDDDPEQTNFFIGKSKDDISFLIDNHRNVGFFLQTPIADFHIAENKEVLFGASNTGAGSKLMWIPEKSAFRVGKLEDFEDEDFIGSKNWDPDSIGNVSFAAGYNTKATGDHSVAMGYNTSAEGRLSTAMGLGTKASGQRSTAMGGETEASGPASTAMGTHTEASGWASTALGLFTKASGRASTSTGQRTIAESLASMALGRYNLGGGSPTAWIETDPLFEVGIGTNNLNRKNALTILKNGFLGLNTATPNALLEIKQPTNTPGAGLRFLNSGFSSDSLDILLDNNGSLRFIFNGNDRSLIDATSGAYNQLSDRRLKKNIQPLKPVIDKVMRLKPSRYHYSSNISGKPESIGFIAQDVEKIFPELVKTSGKYKALSYDGFAVLAIKALQEQQKIIKIQQSEINTLKARMNRIEYLEAALEEIRAQPGLTSDR